MIKSNIFNKRFIFSVGMTILLLYSHRLFSQSFKNDKLNVPALTATYGFCLPMADLSDRYTIFSQAGSSFLMKFKSNITVSLEGLILFSNNYRGESPLRSILNDNGTITNIHGDQTLFTLGMRGMQFQIKGGYIISKYSHNPNSGITLSAGAGFFQSKYWIDQRGQNTPQIMGEYVKGYDKMSNGFALTQFIGYTYFHNKNFLNVYAGIEFTEAWTKDRRVWDFALNRKNDTKYNEIMTAFKVGFMIPFIRREAEGKYYY